MTMRHRNELARDVAMGDDHCAVTAAEAQPLFMALP
jgi:hypothetical protein